MKFKKRDLQDLACEGKAGESGELKVVQKTMDDKSRWAVGYTMVFQFGEQFFESSYREGATECQDEAPYEYEKDEIECDEVVPVTKEITVYELKEPKPAPIAAPAAPKR